MDVDARKLRILQAIVEDYILSNTPVGSRTLSKTCGLGVSSATIRNEMADLEHGAHAVGAGRAMIGVDRIPRFPGCLVHHALRRIHVPAVDGCYVLVVPGAPLYLVVPLGVYRGLMFSSIPQGS